MSRSPHFPVSPAKEKNLKKRMEAVGLAENDLEETFFQPGRSRGRKRSGEIGVELHDRRSGLHIRCQKSSRQALNRFLARRALVRKLEARQKKKKDVQAPPCRKSETREEHLSRMLYRSFEKDILAPFPNRATEKLHGNAWPKALEALKKGESGPRPT